MDTSSVGKYNHLVIINKCCGCLLCNYTILEVASFNFVCLYVYTCLLRLCLCVFIPYSAYFSSCALVLSLHFRSCHASPHEPCDCDVWQCWVIECSNMNGIVLC